MDECLRIIDEKKETPNDDILLQQVRLQLISDKMNQTTLYDGAAERENQPKDISSHSSESLHSQFQDMKIKLLASPETDGRLLGSIYSLILFYALLTMSQKWFYYISSMQSWRLHLDRHFYILLKQIPRKGRHSMSELKQ